MRAAAQVDGIELFCWLEIFVFVAVEDGVAQLARAILLTEVEAETFLIEAGEAPAEIGHPCIFLKARRVIGVDHLDGGFIFAVVVGRVLV